MNSAYALNEAVGMAERRHGAKIIRLGDLPSKRDSAVSTGLEQLDEALDIGGMPRGGIVEISGYEMSGKTALVLQIARQIQQAGGNVMYVDADHTLSSGSLKNSGAVTEGLYVLDPGNLEDALDAVKLAVPVFDAVIIDSLTALPTRGELNSGMDGVPNETAKIMSSALRCLLHKLSKSGCILIITTQVREKIGVMFGNPEFEPGGRALRYYASVRLKLRMMETIKERGISAHTAPVIGQKIRISVAKNKCGTPYRSAEVDLIYGRGMK